MCVRVCVCVCVTIAECSGYPLCFSNQTDQADKTEGLDREGFRDGEIGGVEIGDGGCE